MTGPDDEAYDAEVLAPRGSWRLERRGHERAVCVDGELRASFHGQPPGRSVGGAGRIAALCVLVIVLVVVLFVIGVVLVLVHPSFWLVNLGLLLVIVALVFRPRFGRPQGRPIPRSSAPLLFDLVDRVSTVARVSPPDRLVLDLGEQVTWSRAGLRGVSTLRLGARWWATLGPQLRVALLAHELAGALDPNRGALIRPVVTTFERLIAGTHGERTLGYLRRRDRPRGNIILTIGRRLQWLVSRPLVPPFAALRTAALRSRLLADYVADGVAAEVAGTAAAVGLADREMYRDDLDRVVYYAAANRRPRDWPGAVDVWVAARAGELDEARAQSARTISTWDGAVPAGRRASVLESSAVVDPQLPIDPNQTAPLDAELAAWYDALHREVLGAREFTERRTTPLRP